MANYENEAYAKMSAVNKTAGKDVLACIFDATGTTLLAIGGQGDSSIERSAESIDASDKLSGGWGSSIPGMKSFASDISGAAVPGDAGLAQIEYAFESSLPLVIKYVNIKKGLPLYGGLVSITKFALSYPKDDLVAYDISFEGIGPLTNLEGLSGVSQMPDGIAIPIIDLVATQGSTTGQIALTFSAATGSSAVSVYTKTGTGVWTLATTTPSTINASATSAVITGLTTGTTYLVKMVVTGGAKAGTSNISSAPAK